MSTPNPAAPPSFETLQYAVDKGVATITLHRPEKLNAFTPRMMQDLIDAFDATDADDDVRAVIVTGSGRAFCAGADLSSGGSTFDYEKRYGASKEAAHRDGGGRVALRIFRSLKPVIAAVNGPAVGIGVTMQLPMDIRLAATDAKFGFVFARRGITPEAASSWFLSRVVGISTALEWCYTGRVFSAQEALERGLVRSLHAPEDLLPAAQALAREIADNAAPVSVAISRQLIWRMAGASHPMEAHRLDSRAIQSRGQSADVKEGVSAFLEKRPASFPERVSQDMPDFFDWGNEPPFI
ncbi:crotonase/enoyl-CoA hydratase family protein [Cupriavidus basilensis]|uniref:Crotonase/enoyl-CoA hydratase family protein n=1 Tax=Cupriavidus basilensis TaxID=68895 RepID=A0A643FY15_9BURK|nr:crotonase/enoyl-CoA hydratase family protein [Cupriavidus basilensis]QOT79810.1 crotonase/enoyl-CoA hydratase family protein [Cupriavidus basilensis]